MFNYELKESEIHIGSELIRIECIADLNRTIDEWFATFGQAAKTEQETKSLEELCPYFGVIWASARALCEALSAFSSDLKGASVLEVGCGLALPSLYCAKLGAHVTATDFHPEVPRFLERNVILNGVTDLHFVAHDWKSESSQLGQFDWVIGSDILYVRHCKPDGRILLADPARPYLQGFSDEMRKLGFAEESHVITVPDEPQAKDIFLLSYRAQ